MIDNFRIVDNNINNYNINKITAYEYRTDSKAWKEDVEFTMSYSQSEDLSLVLVLDRSNSLGTDFETIKTYALDFIEQVYATHPGAKIGIVDFADDVKQFPLTTLAQKTSLKNYVSSLKQGQFTALYDAMDKGINMLMASKSQSRVLLTFTDGQDNMATAPVSATYLQNKIKSENNSYKISSFLIGLEGKGSIDKVVLNNLALNGGTAYFPGNVKDLKTVFGKLSNVISNVYNLTYLRNQQVIAKTNPAKLKFVIETTQK